MLYYIWLSSLSGSFVCVSVIAIVQIFWYVYRTIVVIIIITMYLYSLPIND